MYANDNNKYIAHEHFNQINYLNDKMKFTLMDIFFAHTKFCIQTVHMEISHKTNGGKTVLCWRLCTAIIHHWNTFPLEIAGKWIEYDTMRCDVRYIQIGNVSRLDHVSVSVCGDARVFCLQPILTKCSLCLCTDNIGQLFNECRI